MQQFLQDPQSQFFQGGHVHVPVPVPVPDPDPVPVPVPVEPLHEENIVPMSLQEGTVPVESVHEDVIVPQSGTVPVDLQELEPKRRHEIFHEGENGVSD